MRTEGKEQENREQKREELRCGEGQAPQTGDAAEREITIKDLSEQWLTDRRVQIKESSYIKYRNLLQQYIIPGLGEIPVSQLDVDRLRAFHRWLLTEAGRKGNGLAPKTVSDVFTLLRNMLRYARIQQLPVSCTGTEIRTHRVHTELKVLSREEQRQLLRYLAAHPTDRNVGILISLLMGLRVGELCALRWEDVSLREQTIYVHKTMQRLQRADAGEPRTRIIVTDPKSPSANRVIPIPPLLLPYLNAIWTGHGYVLTGSECRVEPRLMEQHLKRVLRRAGLPEVKFHCLRHTFATQCVEAGFDIRTLSDILGHSSITITMNRYVHPTLCMKRENMNRLSAVFLNGLTHSGSDQRNA